MRKNISQVCQIGPVTMRVPHVNQEVSLHSKDQPSVARGVSRTLLKDWGKLSDDEIEVRKLAAQLANDLSTLMYNLGLAFK